MSKHIRLSGGSSGAGGSGAGGGGAHEFHRHLLRPETGDMKVEVEGAGDQCLDLTQILERLLGMTDTSSRKVKAGILRGWRRQEANRVNPQRLISHSF